MFVTSACHRTGEPRGVRLDVDTRTVEPFDVKESAALFVGVRDFPYDRDRAEVRFAVDDAVDLAFVVAFDERVRLVEPARMILALSGEPQKAESKRSLERLVTAGAQVRPAGLTDVLTALDEQKREAGRKGVLVIAFATHGMSIDGTLHLLTATSLLRHHETTISENKIRDVSRSDAGRSLILLDACRERLHAGERSTTHDPRSAAPLIRAMAGTHGQVVLGTAEGEFAYDDDRRGNGVLTAAVIDGLRCQAATDEQGLVTADTLARFVEQRVMTWIRKNKQREVSRATQWTADGAARAMPLSSCSSTRVSRLEQIPPTPPHREPPSPVEKTVPARSVGKIPLDARYDVVLSGRTAGGSFRVAGILMAVPGETHPLDLAIRTNPSAISSGVRGSLYFFTNSRLSAIVGAADHVKQAAVDAGSVAADGTTGRVRIEIDPGSVLGNPLNLMTLDSGMLAIGKQIVSGTIDAQFDDDGTVHGSVRFSTGPYAAAGNIEYAAELTGRRATLTERESPDDHDVRRP